MTPDTRYVQLDVHNKNAMIFTKIHKPIQVAELRKHLAHYLRSAEKEPVVVSTERGADARVIVSTGVYNKLVEAYQDHADAKTLERLVGKERGTARMAWKTAKRKA